MGACFSSKDKAGQQNGGGSGYRPQQRRVRPSDEDGEWPLAGSRTVDHEADIYIAKFYRNQSNCSAEHAAMAPPTPAPPAQHPAPA